MITYKEIIITIELMYGQHETGASNHRGKATIHVIQCMYGGVWDRVGQ